jgi:hypothetical protein
VQGGDTAAVGGRRETAGAALTWADPDRRVVDDARHGVV